MSKLVIEDEKLMSEWDYEKNYELGLDPSKITLGSNKKTWWKCLKCGYEWETLINNRSKNHNCPNCSNNNRKPRGQSLDQLNPNLALEWNFTKNRDLKPSQVGIGSKKKVWWKCSKGHEWEAVIQFRPSGVRVKTATVFPALVAMVQIPIIGKVREDLHLEKRLDYKVSLIVLLLMKMTIRHISNLGMLLM